MSNDSSLERKQEELEIIELDSRLDMTIDPIAAASGSMCGAGCNGSGGSICCLSCNKTA